MVARFCSVLVVVLVASCGRTAQQHPGGSSTAGGNAGAGGTSFGASSGFGGDLPLACPGSDPPDWPLRLLSDYELTNELQQVEATPDAEARYPTQSRLFNPDGNLEPATGAFVGSQSGLAHRVAQQLASDPAKLKQLVGCNIEDEQACRSALLDFVLRRLFRGLASAETETELGELFEQGQALGGDFASGIRAVLEVALQSPEFLYRFELGRPAAELDPPWSEPTDFELASRLSFLLWDGGPDDVLLSAAAAGQLSDPDVLEEQARRMVKDPRAQRAVARFYRELIGAKPPSSFDTTLNPNFTPAVYELMRSELDQFVVDATFSTAGDYRALFAPVTWVNGPLADFYGYPPVSGEHFRRVDLDPARYAGLLTVGAWLSSARSSWSSPTLRGFAVLRGFTCREIPPPPPSVPGMLPEPDGTFTTRQRFEQHGVDPACASCHHLMDPIGFGLEHFDAVGHWRETENKNENNLPIDASGMVTLDEGEVEFDGAPGLAQALIESSGTRDCFVTQWQRFAFGRSEAEASRCSYEELREAFLTSGENVQALLVALTQTESFRYRKVQEGQP